MQTKTALVETAGSKFAEECQALLAQQRFDQLASRLIANTELVFTKSPAQGRCCTCTAPREAAHLLPRRSRTVFPLALPVAHMLT